MGGTSEASSFPYPCLYLCPGPSVVSAWESDHYPDLGWAYPYGDSTTVFLLSSPFRIGDSDTSRPGLSEVPEAVPLYIGTSLNICTGWPVVIEYQIRVHRPFGDPGSR